MSFNIIANGIMVVSPEKLGDLPAVPIVIQKGFPGMKTHNQKGWIRSEQTVQKYIFRLAQRMGTRIIVGPSGVSAPRGSGEIAVEVHPPGVGALHVRPAVGIENRNGDSRPSPTTLISHPIHQTTKDVHPFNLIPMHPTQQIQPGLAIGKGPVGLDGPPLDGST